MLILDFQIDSSSEWKRYRESQTERGRDREAKDCKTETERKICVLHSIIMMIITNIRHFIYYTIYVRHPTTNAVINFHLIFSAFSPFPFLFPHFEVKFIQFLFIFIYKFGEFGECVISYGYFLYLNPFFRCRWRRWSTLLPKYATLIRLRRSRLRGRYTSATCATGCIGAMFNSFWLVFVDLVLHDRGADIVNVWYIRLCRLIAMFGWWWWCRLLGRRLMQLVLVLLLELMICNQFAGITAARFRNGPGRMGRWICRWIQ